MGATKAAATIIPRGTSNAAFAQLSGCSVTRSGTTATLTKTGTNQFTTLANSDKVLIQGFGLEEFNGIFTISNLNQNNGGNSTFTYTIKQDPGGNPSGTPGTVDKVTLGTALDVSGSYGGYLFGGIQNSTSAPAVAPEVWIGRASANNEYDYVWSRLLAGDTTVNSFTPINRPIDAGVMFINIAVCRNTSAAVDCFVLASHITAG